MKKDSKDIKHTIKATKQSKNYRKPMDSNTAVWVEEYLNFFTGKMQPVPEAFLDKLAEELINYAETTEVLRIEWFFTKKRMLPLSGRNWAKRYERFGEAYKSAQFIIGMRREQMALTRDISDSLVLKSLYKFDPMYAEIRQDDIDVRKEIASIAEQSKPTTIIMGQLQGLEEYKKIATNDHTTSRSKD